jgi:hypothetical protein
MKPHEILEELSKRGYAPTLLYDDDGHWLVTDTGMQPISYKDGEYTNFVDTNDKWSDNITDAVNIYLVQTGEKL